MAEVFDENELNELEERLLAASEKHGLGEDDIAGLNPVAEFTIGSEFVLLRRFQGESDSWELLSDGTTFNVPEGEVPEELLKEVARREKAGRAKGKKKTVTKGGKQAAQGKKKATSKTPAKRAKK